MNDWMNKRQNEIDITFILVSCKNRNGHLDDVFVKEYPLSLYMTIYKSCTKYTLFIN